ncbi:MAG: hypothetical protein JO004_05010 [Methylobacteriaceae bacterium]|nr:hypothetical protein [Methylobacteriaceae bacterium]
MSDFVERVSRALCQSAGHDPDGGQRAGAVEEANSTFFTQMARAAVEAMRDPTEAMIEAARDEILVADAPGAWRKMIEVALSEG